MRDSTFGKSEELRREITLRHAFARDGGLPRGLNHVDPRMGVPDRSLILLFGLSLVMLVACYTLEVDLATALLIPSGAAILVYIIRSASGIRLLGADRTGRILPWISLVASLAVLPFVGLLAGAAIVVVAAGLLYSLSRRPAAGA